MLQNNRRAVHSAAFNLQGIVTFLLCLEKKLQLDQRIGFLYCRVFCLFAWFSLVFWGVFFCSFPLQYKTVFLWHFNFNMKPGWFLNHGLSGALILSFQARCTWTSTTKSVQTISVQRHEFLLCARHVWAHLRVIGNSPTSPDTPLSLMVWC